MIVAVKTAVVIVVVVVVAPKLDLPSSQVVQGKSESNTTAIVQIGPAFQGTYHPTDGTNDIIGIHDTKQIHRTRIAKTGEEEITPNACLRFFISTQMGLQARGNLDIDWLARHFVAIRCVATCIKSTRPTPLQRRRGLQTCLEGVWVVR